MTKTEKLSFWRGAYTVNVTLLEVADGVYEPINIYTEKSRPALLSEQFVRSTIPIDRRDTINESDLSEVESAW